MPLSFSQEVELTCPQCGQSFKKEVWLILDPTERPDVAEQMAGDTLHTVECPHCGAEGMLNVPMLLYRADLGRGFFSPAEQSDEEQARGQAGSLVGRLAQELGEDAAREIAQNLALVPRHYLPLALNADPDTALQEAADESRQIQEQAVAARQAMDSLPPQERARAIAEHMLAGQPLALQPNDLDQDFLAAVAQLRQEAEPGSQRAEMLRNMEEEAQHFIEMAAQSQQGGAGPLRHLLLSLLRLCTWVESRRVVQENPILLSDDALVELDEMIAAAHAEGEEEEERNMQEHRELLERCREVGVEKAFTEKILE